jgi:hypothetical protein
LRDSASLASRIKFPTGEATQGGMAGSATMEWPSDPQKELGLVILLIDRFAQIPDAAMDFSHTSYYAGTS